MALSDLLERFDDLRDRLDLRRNLIPAGIAIAVGAVAWVGIGPLFTGDGEESEGPAAAPPPAPAPAPAAPPPAPTYPSVLVASGSLSAGVLLSTDLVRWQEWEPPMDLAELNLAVLEDVVPLRAVLGAVTRRAFDMDEPITWDGLLAPGHPGFISAVLAPGMLGVTVEVDRATTAANIIYPGDRVDVIMVAGGAEGGGPASRTIVRRARVLAVGSTVLSLGRYGRINLTVGGDVEPVPPPVDANYTLEVSPADAERIAVATSAGRLTLAMRALGARDGEAPSGAVPVRLDEVMPGPLVPSPPATVRILRGTDSDSARAEA